MNAATPAVALEGVWLGYTEARTGARREVLAGLDLAVAAGEFLAVVGPSGCGKTSLLNLLAGFLAPDRGRATHRGATIEGPSPQRVVVAQGYSLFPWMTAAENIGFGPRVQGWPADRREAAVARLVEEVGLAGAEHRYPRELSGGMQQRAALARALAVDPEVLLMDEPFGALDAQTRAHMHGELSRLWSARQKTVVFVTHSIEEAALLADRVVVLRERGIALERRIEAPRPRDLWGDARLREAVVALTGAVRGAIRDD